MLPKILKEHNLTISGFTLLEILVSISIMGTVFGLGAVKYRDFNNSQLTKSALQDLKNNLRNIQGYASSGVKPAGCASLDGYRVTYVNSTSYTYRAYCGGNPSGTAVTKNLPADINFAQAFGYFVFQPLSKGSTAAISIILKNTKNISCAQIDISLSGEISDGGSAACPSVSFPATFSSCSVPNALSCTSNSIYIVNKCSAYYHQWRFNELCLGQKCNPATAQCTTCTLSCGFFNSCCFNTDGSQYCNPGFFSCPNYP